jgi:hypothetical protein
MRVKPFPIAFALFTLLAVLLTSQGLAGVVTFDDLHETASASFIANGYQGLVWSNFDAMNAVLNPTIYPFITNGFYYGMVSASNVVVADIAEIDSGGTNFDFSSAYLTGAWNSNLNIEVQGFRGGTLLYDQTVVASATNPTLFSFNYLDVDRLYFVASGGQPAFGTPGSSKYFAMDNFDFEFIPEPSTFLLTACGALTLFALFRRRRT